MARWSDDAEITPGRRLRRDDRVFRVVLLLAVLASGALYVAWLLGHDRANRDLEVRREVTDVAEALGRVVDWLGPADEPSEAARTRLTGYLEAAVLVNPTWTSVTMYLPDDEGPVPVASAGAADRGAVGPRDADEAGAGTAGDPAWAGPTIIDLFEVAGVRAHRGTGDVDRVLASVTALTGGEVAAVLAVVAERHVVPGDVVRPLVGPVLLILAVVGLMVALPGVSAVWIALAATIAITHVAVVVDQDRRLDTLHAVADGPLAFVQDAYVDLGTRELEGLAHLFLSRDDVPYQEFLEYAAVIAGDPIAALSAWVPAVRSDSSLDGRLTVREAIDVWALDAANVRTRVELDGLHYPIAYTAPRDGNAALDGFDLASESRPAAALDAAAAGPTTASAPMRLPHESDGRPVALIARSVVRGGSPPLDGFVVLALRFDELMRAAARHDREASTFVFLELTHVASDGVLTPLVTAGPGVVADAGSTTARPLFAFGQTYLATARATPAFMGLNPRRTPWWALGFGLVVSASLAVGQWLTSDRSAQLERQVTARTAELRESETRFRSFAEAAPLGIMLLDDHAHVRYVNPAFVDLFGVTAADVPDVDTWFAYVYPDSGEREAFRTVWRTALEESRTDEAGARPVTFTLTRLASGVREIEFHAASIGALDAVVFHDVTARKAAEENLARIAHYDGLTGVPNRRLLADRLRQAIARADRTGRPLAVSMLDLDGFKTVNDRYGHEVGDELLIEVARRLRGVIRAEDTVARLGGDEFILLAGDLDDPDEAGRLAERVLRALDRPLDLQGNVLRIGASLGVTQYPQDDVDGETLLRHADRMLYRAKAAGRGRYVEYDPTANDDDARVRETSGRVAAALASGEFLLHYQPQVDLVTGDVVGFEALTRWRHPKRGLLRPDEFLPHVLRGPLAIAFGTWSIDTALAQMVAWQRDGMAFLGGATISVNVAAPLLVDDALVRWLTERLASHPTEGAGTLQLEIVESMAIDAPRRLAAVMASCRELGVGFALDDFGTGYASLMNIRELPVDWLKVDQAFVRDMLDDPEDLIIVESVLKLGDALARRVVAEGIESRGHAALLRRMGGRYAQGDAIAAPLPPEDVAAWLRDWHAIGSWRDLEGEAARSEHAARGRAIAAHRAWYDTVRQELRDPVRGATTASFGSDGCGFGRWYRGRGRLAHGDAPGFHELGARHDEVHQLADDLLVDDLAGDVGAGGSDGGAADLERAEAAFVRALEGVVPDDDVS